MPIKPPNLDDRRYADIVREARALIPQYCPEWTNLSDADPGITLVQLFAWMTEMTIFRLNRVPDKTYVHFLNFIGEERREARPARVPVTFELRTPDAGAVELPAFTRVSTRQLRGSDALHYLTTDRLTVHDCGIVRVVAVRAGAHPTVREIPFQVEEERQQVLLFGGGSGVQPFRMDPIANGPSAYTRDQFFYVGHDDFGDMDYPLGEEMDPGRVRLRTATEENLPIAGLFTWEKFTGEEWVPVQVTEEEAEVLGVEEISIVGHLPKIKRVARFGTDEDPFDIPDVSDEPQYWLRGRVDYERWLAHRMAEDLEITWRDDRSAEDRLISNWDVRDTGRSLEFFVQDMPPIRSGWTVQLTMVDRSMPAGKAGYFPRYRWSFRRGDIWEEIPAERVRMHGTSIILTGPFTDMSNDGYNLRAERLESVELRRLIPDLEVEGTWLRPVVVYLAAGPESKAAEPIENESLPQLPYQMAPTMPPLLGMKFFIGSDLFENRAQKPVMLEIEVSFSREGELIPEPTDAYHLQFAYRAVDTWRVVWSEDDRYAQFTFADLDPDGAKQAARRKIRIFLDPKEQLKGLHRASVGGRETAWLRFELTRAALTWQPDKKTAPVPISIKVHSVRLGVEGNLGKTTYEQPMPGIRAVTVEYRPKNRRLTRAIVRQAGRLREYHPFDTFIDLSVDDEGHGHHALYLQLDKPLPQGARHALMFKCRGETYLSQDVQVTWELLEDGGRGRPSWFRIASADDPEGGYALNRSGVLAFPYADVVKPSPHGAWIRALFRTPDDADLPPLPPVSHLLLNSVDAVNLHEYRVEKFNGLGIPHQTVQLRRYPVFLHPGEGEQPVFPFPDRFRDIRVFVEEGDGERREWRRAPANSLLTASKDDRVFVVDPVEGTLTFGNGIRGRMLPAGNYNVSVEVYHTVPGDVGNVGPGTIEVVDGYSDLVGVRNVLPAAGGRNAESIDEILRRAPSVLTSRDRAVTRLDFEVIAKEASGEVARAACEGRMGADGEVEVVILPQKRPGERTPDPFLATGLKEHVERYLGRRCLVNVQPRVRLATFKEVDVAVDLRLRPNANFVLVREQARAWVRRFLDPYVGGLDGAGWPFQGTLFAQDFGRMVTDIPEVRHVVRVHVYDVNPEDPTPGWERGQGQSTLVLDEHDLFILRHVRVVSEELA